MSRIQVTVGLVFVLIISGCKGDDDDSAAEDQYPDIYCPGDPSGSCDPSDDQTLYAGAAKISITPQCWETWNDINDNQGYGVTQGDTFNDCGCDRLCEGDDGYPGPDEGESDGTFQAIWLGGSSQGRPMNGINDDVWTRAVVLRQGNTTLAIVSQDLVGLFRKPIKEVEEQVKASAELDYLLVSSTHTHQGPDTVGIWGPSFNSSGIVDDYFAQMKTSLNQVVEEAIANLVPVDVIVSQYDVQPSDCDGKGINNFNVDHRVPNIVDERIFTLLFQEEGSGQTVASLVNWPNHPEVMIDDVIQSSGFAHYLREGLENGIETPEGTVSGLGGVSLYVQGMCGGMMTPLGTNTSDLFGQEWSGDSFEHVQAIGDYLASFSLNSIADGEQLDDPALSFRFKEVVLPIENEGYWLYINMDVLDRDLHYFDIPDPDELITEYNMPSVHTEVGVIGLGPVQIVTVPGEMLPEFGIGGYDGSHTGPLQDIIDEGATNPPDLALAPEPPYITDQMDGTYKLFFGLANDELGYFIPPFQYELGEPPYLSEAPGDHYEESNSVGPSGATTVVDTIGELLAWEFPQ